jgi:hypothetical protein
MKLTTLLNLVPRSKNAWSYTSTPTMPSWCGVQFRKKAQGQLYLYLYHNSLPLKQTPLFISTIILSLLKYSSATI